MSDIPVLDRQPAPEAADEGPRPIPVRKYTMRAHAKKKGAARGAIPRTRADVHMAPAPGPSARAEPAREAESLDSAPRTRIRRDQRSVGMFDLPAHMKKPGWDYQFWVTSVVGAPTEGSDMATIYDGGWRPEPNKNWPNVAPPGSDPNAPFVRGGQMLFSRPMHLTIEAKQEDYAAADQQVRDRVQGALEGRVHGGEGVANIRGVKPVGLQLEMVGEAGSQPPILRQN